MTPLAWIVLGGLGMAAIALVGGITLLLPERILRSLLLPLVSFAAGSLVGGALFHMLPAGLRLLESPEQVCAWTAAGFTTFLALELLLHWHHRHRLAAEGAAHLSWLVLIGDGLHNLWGGLLGLVVLWCGTRIHAR